MTMTKYHFRIKFLLPTGHSLNFEKKKIQIQTNDISYVLSSFNTEKIKDTNILILSGGPFNTKAEAESFGCKAKQALMISTAELRTGIDLGNDKASGGLSNYITDKIFKDSGVKIINDVHGLSVYEDTYPVSFASVGPVNLGIGHGSQNFISIFTKSYESNPNINGE